MYPASQTDECGSMYQICSQRVTSCAVRHRTCLAQDLQALQLCKSHHASGTQKEYDLNISPCETHARVVKIPRRTGIRGEYSPYGLVGFYAGASADSIRAVSRLSSNMLSISPSGVDWPWGLGGWLQRGCKGSKLFNLVEM